VTQHYPQIIARSGLQATSLRVGQITGGPTGAWATTDWVPILVKSGLALGSLLDLPGVSILFARSY
jgi:thioester reductase-like protein